MSRNPRESDYYRPLQDETSYQVYRHSLHQFALAILLTLEGNPSSYEFTLTDGDRMRASDLVEELKSNREPRDIGIFHSFIMPFLYGRDPQASDEDYSKWNEPVEGFMALHNLQEDGNFKPPNQVTQLFAQLHYHIRGAMLYEGIRTADDFGSNVYKLSLLCQGSATGPDLLSVSELLSFKSRRISSRLPCPLTMLLMSINGLRLPLPIVRIRHPTLEFTKMA